MILLDTHVVHWLAAEEHQLGRKTRHLIERTDVSVIHVSVVTLWEIGLLIRKGRLKPDIPGGLKRLHSGLMSGGFRLIELDLDMVLTSDSLSDFHDDPADRFLTGTALALELAFVTADRKILGWDGPLKRIDART